MFSCILPGVDCTLLVIPAGNTGNQITGMFVSRCLRGHRGLNVISKVRITTNLMAVAIFEGMHIGFGFKSEKIMCWLSPDFFLSRGVRPRGRVSLFCAAKTKVPNKRPPWYRLIPALLVFRKVPFGLFRRKTAMLGAVQGTVS